MIDPGRLNRRLVLEAPVETPGGVARTYSDVATIWAEVMGHRRARVFRDDLAARGRRSHPDITTQHRLRLDARLFRIVSVREHDGSGRFLDIHAEERVE